jgi:hypothetical protein
MKFSGRLALAGIVVSTLVSGCTADSQGQADSMIVVRSSHTLTADGSPPALVAALRGQVTNCHSWAVGRFNYGGSAAETHLRVPTESIASDLALLRSLPGVVIVSSSAIAGFGVYAGDAPLLQDNGSCLA